MSEIRKWLVGIGLDQYADAFQANDIDMDLLKQVDDQTLKDIGIASAGHRLRIELRQSCILPHARARERVVPISELVFGTLTQNPE